MFTYCFASGEIEIGPKLPKGALPIFRGNKRDAELVQQRGRLAYRKPGQTDDVWLVPGIPEAKDQHEAYDAFVRFKNWAAPSVKKQMKDAAA